jgi:hypothetical protein
METEQHHHDREKLITVRRLHNEVEASIVKALLEAAGIPCTLVTPVPHNVYPFTVDGLAEIRVNVLDADVEAARALLEDYERAGAEEDLPQDE